MADIELCLELHHTAKRPLLGYSELLALFTIM